MYIDEQRHSRIIQYLDKQMSGEEQDLFEMELVNHPSLQRELHFMRSVMQGVKYVSLRQELSELWDQQLDKETIGPQAAPFNWRIIGIAASILFLTLIGFWYQNRVPSKGQEIVQNWSEADLEFQSNMSYSPSDLRSQIESNLVNEDYPTAIKLAKQLLHQNPSDPYAHYLWGIAAVGNRSYQEGIGHLLQAADRKDVDFSVRVKWWLALAHIGLNQFDHARTLLQQIQRSPSTHYRKQRIPELLDILADQ